MTSLQLDQFSNVKSDTYKVGSENMNCSQNQLYSTPFEDQSRYGQRYEGKNFQASKIPSEGVNWYEKRPALNVDLSQTMDNLGENQVLDYPDQNEKEKFSPFTPEFGVSDRLTGSIRPVLELPDSIETFKVGDKEISVSVIIIIIILILLIGFGIYVYMSRNKTDSIWEKMKKTFRKCNILQK